MVTWQDATFIIVTRLEPSDCGGYCFQSCNGEMITLPFFSVDSVDRIYFRLWIVNCDGPWLMVGCNDGEGYSTYTWALRTNFDSLTIQGKVYRDVSYFRQEGSNSYPISKLGCYYNKVDGLLKFEKENNVIWELINKE